MSANLDFEKRVLREGYEKVIGIDEVGRGCLAGPLVVCAVSLPFLTEDEFEEYSEKMRGVTDSKKLSDKRRRELHRLFIDSANSLSEEYIAHYGIGWVWPSEIDDRGMTASVALAVDRALNAITLTPDYALCDMNCTSPSFEVRSIEYEQIEKGDAKSLSIAAASIIAKVERDTYMIEQSANYPQFGFEKHKGYGTKLHKSALQSSGPIKGFHRYSFKPVKAIEQRQD